MVALFALRGRAGRYCRHSAHGVTIAIQPFLSYQFDLLLETTIIDGNTTGRVRALFRTAYNIAALAAPLLLGALLANSDSYGRVFIAAAAMLIPIIVLFATKQLPTGPAPKFARMREHSSQFCTTAISRRVNLSAKSYSLFLSFISGCLSIRRSTSTMCSVSRGTTSAGCTRMLVPTCLLNIRPGWIADRFLGDKELMLAGFLIAGGAVAAFCLLTPATSLAVILVILVASRIGAALVER